MFLNDKIINIEVFNKTEFNKLNKYLEEIKEQFKRCGF